MKPSSVLLVDDDPSVRSALTRALEVEGFSVCATGDATHVVDSVQRQEPDIMLLDLGLGKTNGWDIFEEVSRSHPLIPIVIISARSGQFEIAKLAGVSAFVEKPIEIGQLVQTMKRLLAEDADTRMQRLALRVPRPRFVSGRSRPKWFFSGRR